MLIQKDRIEHYTRFDKEGNLSAEFLYKNGHSFLQKTWKNKKLEWVQHYNENGNRICDSTFIENNTIQGVTLFINDKVYKNIIFYRDGKVANEIFRSISDRDVFVISYDSLTQNPSMYYRQDTIWEDQNNRGVYLGEPVLFPVDSVKIKGNTTKKSLSSILR